MKVRYIYSACVVIETSTDKILCDPWFTPGAYDGAWYQYPVIDDPIAAIGPVDYIWISHIHPDHYDPVFLRDYLERYPDAYLVTREPHLIKKMRRDRLPVRETVRVGAHGMIFRHPTSEMDTALAVIDDDNQCVVNLNDCPFDAALAGVIGRFCEPRDMCALLPYAGAGPYPQTFYFPTLEAKRRAAEAKRQQFLDLFQKWKAALQPRWAIPFAGKYWLGGALWELNRWRGMADATEVEGGLVLADGGAATLDLATGEVSALRTEPYAVETVAENIYLPSWCRSAKMAYEREIKIHSPTNLPIAPLLAAAFRRARSAIYIQDPYWLVINAPHAGSWVMNLASDEPPQRVDDYSLNPRLEITLDARYLFGLLTRLYHWNNAEVGSQYRSIRVPDVYDPRVYEFLNELHV